MRWALSSRQSENLDFRSNFSKLSFNLSKVWLMFARNLNFRFQTFTLPAPNFLNVLEHLECLNKILVFQNCQSDCEPVVVPKLWCRQWASQMRGRGPRWTTVVIYRQHAIATKFRKWILSGPDTFPAYWTSSSKLSSGSSNQNDLLDGGVRRTKTF